jgi:dGTPase
MILMRKDVEAKEKEDLAPYAAFSAEATRLVPETECDLRSAFQRDRDRIVHCKAFRRLKHKTQVFLAPTGDHYRTRLTHTLEVSQIGRTLARALRLNQDLTEAICLGHDLGHTPFGHAGESVLGNLLPGGFTHQEQSLRVVDVLEKDGQGLNLTLPVRDGILKHSKGKGAILDSGPQSRPATVEGQIVRVSDIIAYIAHDVDDAIRGGVIQAWDIPKKCLEILGSRTSARIDTMVRDLLRHSVVEPSFIELAFSPRVGEAMVALRDFLYESVYNVDDVHADFIRSSKVVRELFQVYLEEDKFFLKEIGSVPADPEDRMRSVCDFIAGMTDRYALELYNRIFLPRPWGVY